VRVRAVVDKCRSNRQRHRKERQITPVLISLLLVAAHIAFAQFVDAWPVAMCVSVCLSVCV